MSNISDIKRYIKSDLDKFNIYFSGTIKTKIPLLNIIMRYILRTKGKQLRPILVLLTSKLFGNISKSSLTAATLIELLHTASLIHDDVIDDSNERRGFFSIKALWKSKIAVLVGDYLLSRGLLVAMENKESNY